MNRILSLLVCMTIYVPLSAQRTVIANPRLNIVYAGLANPLEALAERSSCNDLTLVTDNGRIEKQEKCSYLFYPGTAGTATVRILKGSKELGAQQFRVKLPPAPSAAIGGKANDVITADRLKEQAGVTAVLHDFEYDVRYVITAFSLTLVRKDGTATTLSTVSGPYFSEQMQRLLQTAEPGDRLVISRIFADGPAGQVPVQQIGLTVK